MKPITPKSELAFLTRFREAVSREFRLKRLLLLCAVVLACSAFPGLAQSPPALHIDYSTGSQARLSWEDTPGIIVLEESDALTPASLWHPYPQYPTLLNGQFSVMVDTTGVRRFFRLHLIETGGLPPDPASIAPPVPQSVATLLGGATEFLYTGSNAIQTGVTPHTIKSGRTAVVRGRVRNRDNVPLSGVTISILNHPEFGHTFSRADAMFDMAVNGGGLLTVKYEKAGFCPVQRQINVPWRDYVMAPDVVMIQMDPIVTPVALGINSPLQVHQGSLQTDADGPRRATVMFMPGTGASLVLANGSTVNVSSLNIRATEFTVGANGPAAMPGVLPPASAYTYCVELSADEAMAQGATSVQFDRPLSVFVENFLGFPVGITVPAGYYDRQKGQWIASANGRVIKVLSITGGLADLDLDGDAAADDAAALAALGVTTEERDRLAQLYTSGQTLWRVPITHFTPWDLNWGFAPPPDAVAPNVPKLTQPVIDDQDLECGSVIGVQEQTLGESVSVSGTPFRLHYQSERTPGRKIANTVLRVPVSGASLPSSLVGIEVEVSLAGRVYKGALPPAPNLSYTVTWDGKDAYGRTLQGSQRVSVRIGYTYRGVYTNTGRFGYNGLGLLISGDRMRTEVTLWTVYDTSVGAWDNHRAFGLGGWSLNVQHAYDPLSRRLLLGNGRQRSAEAMAPIITTAAGSFGVPGFSGDGGPAVAARLNDPRGVAVGPDGSLYIADTYNHVIRRVGPNGIITTVAGIGPFGELGDGGPAVAANVYLPRAVAVGPDGSLYIAASLRIRRVGLDGIITTVAGGGSGPLGDGGPAVGASLGVLSGDTVGPEGIAVGADGSLYISSGGTVADNNNHRIRRVGPDGIITTVAGTGVFGFSGDGGPAVAAKIYNPRGVAVGPDGSLYIMDGGNHRIRRVGPDGIINTVVGTIAGFGGDGGPAVAAKIWDPRGLTVGPDGSLYIADYSNYRIRRVAPDGIITTVAGSGIWGDGSPAVAAKLYQPRGVAVGPDGSLYIVENNHVRRVGSPLSGFSVNDFPLASEDGSEIYFFNSSGRHLKTLDALTGAVRQQFGYDLPGYLTSITDRSGNITSIERTGALPTAIIASGGQRTALTINSDGWLVSATNPAAGAHTMRYFADGLLEQFIDPLANIHRFAYDALGRLIRDEDPAGGSISLARTEQTNGYTVTTTSALGRARAYQVERLPTGTVRRTVTQPSGVRTVRVINTDASEQTTYADGSSSTVTFAPDPRWGMLAPVAASVSLMTPGVPARNVSTSRTATLSNPNDLLSLTRLSDRITDNGVVSTRVFDRATRLLTSTTATGRTSTLNIDTIGRVTQEQITGLAPVGYTYGSNGLLSSVTQGSGATSRIAGFTYNTARYLTGVTDPLGRTMSVAYDLAGRPVTQTLPGGRTIQYAYDASGNETAITPPGRPAHGVAYSPIDQMLSYTPPGVGTGSTTTQYGYSVDRALTRITRPDGQILDFGYESGGGCNCGRLNTLTLPTGVFSFAYDAVTGKLSSITAPDGGILSDTYTGALPTRTAWAGTVTGNVSRAYDNFFRVTSLSVNGTDAIAFQYDTDSLLSRAGNLILSRNAQNGLLTGSTLGNATDTREYDGFGEVTAYTAKYNGSEVFKTLLDYDKLGRITTRTETVEGTTDIFEYGYDLAARLSEVRKNGTVTATYTYDSNGNRLTAPGLSAIPLYDAQDRLISYGSTTYGYSANGELLSKANGAQSSSYQYDTLGNLLKATLPGATAIDYLIDGRNRRIGKKVNGVLVQAFLYQGSLSPIAELDGNNAIVSRFVYATLVNVPDYLIKAGVTYRIITDQLGSPRLVVDVATGTVAQRMDYDESGNVIADTNPGFQPFGFAGGLYDRDTKLVRFGARDYDAETGRWTAKDPIRFAGGDANLYAYAGNDPVNWIDPSGLSGVCAVNLNARPGDPLWIRSKDTRLLDEANPGANAIKRLQPGQEVIFRGVDPTDSRFIQVEQGGEAGHVLRQNLSTQNPATAVLPAPVGRPLNTPAFASSGVGIKG